jgi:uncharacterized protein YggE
MRQLLLVPIFACIASAQFANGLSASGSRTVTFTADEAAFTMVATTNLDGTGQQVKQALQSAGLPNPTVVTVAAGGDPSTVPQLAEAVIFYQITVTIPAASAKDAAKSLEALRAKLPATLKSLQYSVAFNASQATVDAMRQVVLPQLVAEAQKNAQSLADAAGVKLGPIKSIGDSTGGAVYASGDFSSLIIGSPPFNGSAGTQYTFFVNVVFAAVQ